jgi:phosphatidylglycerophosphate synthase
MKSAYYFVNGLTVYRLLMAPVLATLAYAGNESLFRWLLPVSFFTDMLDGWLARKLNVTSETGTRLDSIADDLTICASVFALFIFRSSFAEEQKWVLYSLLLLFLLQNITAVWKYKKLTSFHTYSAKLSALLQGCFLILLFILPQPVYILFYAAALITAVDLIEEIILTLILPSWKANVKGLYWVLQEKKEKKI